MKSRDENRERWLSLYVENSVGVLAKIMGLLAGKLYNVTSITAGETEDPSLSRITIVLMSDDRTLEQVTKQLHRFVEVIKVVDLTDMSFHKLEILFLKVMTESEADIDEVFRLSETFGLKVIDYNRNRVIVRSVTTMKKNNEMARRFMRHFPNRVELVRGGTVAMEALVD